jgi:hypothetical protein
MADLVMLQAVFKRERVIALELNVYFGGWFSINNISFNVQHSII